MTALLRLLVVSLSMISPDSHLDNMFKSANIDYSIVYSYNTTINAYKPLN